MKTKWLGQQLKYDGRQLRPLYNYLEHSLVGASILGFRGPCDVSFEHMIDGEDLLAKSQIAGAEMVHLLLEFFHQNLFSAVALQRLIADHARVLVEEMTQGQIQMRRRGDDLYYEDRKFSISIATLSPVSQLVHFAVNVTQEGTPVKTCGLGDFKIDADAFGQELITRVAAEFANILAATEKVRPAY